MKPFPLIVWRVVSKMLRMEVIKITLMWKKFLTALVAVITFGVITPSHEIWSSVFEPRHVTYSEVQEQKLEINVDTLLFQAQAQSELKFGTKILPKIHEDYEMSIFPVYEEKIKELVTSTSAISTKPSGDHGEKIFHLYDYMTNEDILRAHVRVEKRPQDGYFFTFHYHTVDDNFDSHIDVGEIYWSKNTPPKWLS